ncbi:hypothetical protein FB451DRAFT_1181572 [Mycena latifolia]|nr:hypothetical protein FB451DRAFT_1181572 [Mycena latifolia]
MYLVRAVLITSSVVYLCPPPIVRATAKTQPGIEVKMNTTKYRAASLSRIALCSLERKQINGGGRKRKTFGVVVGPPEQDTWHDTGRIVKRPMTETFKRNGEDITYNQLFVPTKYMPGSGRIYVIEVGGRRVSRVPRAGGIIASHLSWEKWIGYSRLRSNPGEASSPAAVQYCTEHLLSACRSRILLAEPIHSESSMKRASQPASLRPTYEPPWPTPRRRGVAA